MNFRFVGSGRGAGRRCPVRRDNRIRQRDREVNGRWKECAPTPAGAHRDVGRNSITSNCLISPLRRSVLFFCQMSSACFVCSGPSSPVYTWHRWIWHFWQGFFCVSRYVATGTYGQSYSWLLLVAAVSLFSPLLWFCLFTPPKNKNMHKRRK